MTEVAIRLTILGAVQGVGYRAWLEEEAGRLGVDGWVRNRRDGAVEAMLAGTSDAVRALIDRCREGPRGAVVALITEAGVPESPPPGFMILPTV